jgi:hypothetical protein
MPSASKRARLAAGAPIVRAASAVTWSKTRLEAASPATSVAIRRSAACSAVSARWAVSLADRSAVTAASTSEVKAATATNSWLASKLWVSEVRTNGPEPCAVFHTVRDETIASAVAAPVGPNRRAAQIRIGNTMYGTSRCDGTSTRTIRIASRRAASASCIRGIRHDRRVAQTRKSGANTSAPEKSASHQVRKTLPNSAAVITWPSLRDTTPKAALISVPIAAHTTNASTSQTRSSPVRRPANRRNRTAATTTSSVFPSVPPRTVPHGLEKSATNRSPITIPGHTRGPRITRAATPTPTGGQSAVTLPCR